MPKLKNQRLLPLEVVLGLRLNEHLPVADQRRQRSEAEVILRRFRTQPGVILADEVGMGKTYVALAVAYTEAIQNPRGPVIVMVPPNLVQKWEEDLKSFCTLYLSQRRAVGPGASQRERKAADAVRYGVARHSVELLRLLDDAPKERCHLIFVAQGAMNRSQSDKWVRLALIAEALRRHGRGGARRLIQVKGQIHRFMARLLWAVGEERASLGGEKLWQRLLKCDYSSWQSVYNEEMKDARLHLADDPVPKTIARRLHRIDLKDLAQALEAMPVRASGDDRRLHERIATARSALRQVEQALWKSILVETRWRSPLLVLDEAHHLKNPGTSLARQLQSADSVDDLRTGDGAMAQAFDRMLFLTATPFQLGHQELVSVLRRFGDIRWNEVELGAREDFLAKLHLLEEHLNDCQRAAIYLQRCWARLLPEDVGDDVENWWHRSKQASCDALSGRERAVFDAYTSAKAAREKAETALRPWIVRHDKGSRWQGTSIQRRRRLPGAAIVDSQSTDGLPVPAEQLLSFFLAARSAVNPRQDLLGEALSSSYEAFRYTRGNRGGDRDDLDDDSATALSALANAHWYLNEFDHALTQATRGSIHPKISATVRKAVDLWEAGEKVLIFAFYRRTCRALRIHLSEEIERRMREAAQRQLRAAGKAHSEHAVDRLITRIQNRFFDDSDSPARQALDRALWQVVEGQAALLDAASVLPDQRSDLVDVMRRFLRVETSIVRCFSLADVDDVSPAVAVAEALNHTDGSGVSWRQKFGDFIVFLAKRPAEQRALFLEAAQSTKTGGIRVDDVNRDGELDDVSSAMTVANIQVATGSTNRDTRARLMRAFNTPFFPDIFVCSQVMSEGVDLQRHCRHVIHHDLAWNPSSIEQRTGRVDRVGCKAEGRHPIDLSLPYIAGAADERQYHVMTEREQWFRVVMGEDAVARLITPETDRLSDLPRELLDSLSFDLRSSTDPARASPPAGEETGRGEAAIVDLPPRAYPHGAVVRAPLLDDRAIDSAQTIQTERFNDLTVGSASDGPEASGVEEEP